MRILLLLDGAQILCLIWLFNGSSVCFFFSELIFGFEPIVYSVSESVGSLDLGVSFISGNAGQFMPHVNVSTADGTATGKYFIYCMIMSL